MIMIPCESAEEESLVISDILKSIMEGKYLVQIHV